MADNRSTTREPGDYRRARFVIAYRGSGFRGIAPNEGVRTVLGELGAAIERILREPVDLAIAGRTDAGVHAWGQVLSGDLPVGCDLEGVSRRLNKLCGPEIAVRYLEWADPEFHARFSATWRAYRYRVWNDPAPHPLLAEQVWHVSRPVEWGAIGAAADDLVGEHDFSSFCRAPKLMAPQFPLSLVRVIHSARWCVGDDPALHEFHVRGSAFCHQQVRSMVGTLIDIGLGRLPVDAIPEIIAARDRSAAGQIAPPQGLTLWEVGYDGYRWDA